MGPAFARYARTDSPRERGGETIFSLRVPPAGRSWRRRGRASWRWLLEALTRIRLTRRPPRVRQPIPKNAIDSANHSRHKRCEWFATGFGVARWGLFTTTAAIAACVQAGVAVAQDQVQIAQAEIVVIGQRENLLRIPGSGATIEAADLEAARVFSVNEALRQVPGVYPRDEEGLGLRPNTACAAFRRRGQARCCSWKMGCP